jgi:predicted TIM-barrel fold metal-dependent hydrolase
MEPVLFQSDSAICAMPCAHFMNYIDFHTHIFPDRIAKPALEALAEKSSHYSPRTDGTLQGLLDSMDRAGISASLVANIATKPAQMVPILQFCKQIKSERIHPLISFHPSNDTEEVEEIFGEAHRSGIRGVKMHPMYQQFFIDDKYMYGFYELMASFGFFVMFQSGYDIAFPSNRQADVERIKKVADWFKDLTIVCTHVGGWKQWDRIKCLSECQNVYTETSMTLSEVSDEEFVRLIGYFDDERLLFGSDSPWADQKEMLQRTLELKISDRLKEKMFYENAAMLLKLKKT